MTVHEAADAVSRTCNVICQRFIAARCFIPPLDCISRSIINGTPAQIKLSVAAYRCKPFRCWKLQCRSGWSDADFIGDPGFPGRSGRCDDIIVSGIIDDGCIDIGKFCNTACDQVIRTAAGQAPFHIVGCCTSQCRPFQLGRPVTGEAGQAKRCFDRFRIYLQIIEIIIARSSARCFRQNTPDPVASEISGREWKAACRLIVDIDIHLAPLNISFQLEIIPLAEGIGVHQLMILAASPADGQRVFAAGCGKRWLAALQGECGFASIGILGLQQHRGS
ncbi:hypothetical protein D3C73_693290 [compost metagenome]